MASLDDSVDISAKHSSDLSADDCNDSVVTTRRKSTRASKNKRKAASESTIINIADEHVLTTDITNGDFMQNSSYQGDAKSKNGFESDLTSKSEMDVPELDAAPPPVIPVISKASPSPSLKLKERLSKDRRSTNSDDDDIQEVPVQKMELDVIEVTDGDDGPDPHANHLEGMTIIDEIIDDASDDKDRKGKANADNNIDPDTEMVSEDELPAESSKEHLETEAVSDEELPTPTVDLPETEAVSEDELPPEGAEKKKKNDQTLKKVKKTKKDNKVDQEAKPSTETGVKRKLADGEYDPSSPTSEASNEDTPPSKKATLDGPKTPVKPTKLPELEKYWKAVKDDPTDFTGWTYLLQYVDQESDVEAAREAYDAFLSHYPYCYGYWRKYADYEKRKGDKKKCEEVFERGLKAIPLSVDLWIHYLNYCKATYTDNEDFLRSQFQKALDACGLEFRSDRLWESFIKWETEGKHYYNVTQLYDKLLATPTQGYTNHFDNFQEHVKNTPPAKVLSVDEFLTLRREVLQVLKQYDAPLKVVEEGPPGDDDAAPPGEEPPEVSGASDEETTALRERIVSIRRKVHKATVVAVSSRWAFEEGIKRPYFHVKPLERCQLKNWKEYLDYEIAQGNNNRERIIILFERCLIACALYEDFWMRFIRYLEDLPDNVEKIRDVYQRACTIHHPKKPNLHIHWAVYEESQNNPTKAREILLNLEKVMPNMLQISYRRINLERRTANYEEAASLYEHYINNVKSKLVSNNMSIKYARFCWKILNDVDRAIAVLRKALEKEKDNPRLYLQLIDMSMQKTPIPESEILSAIDQFTAKESVDVDQKLLFAQRKVEFLEDFGTDVVMVQKATEEFRRFLKLSKERKKKSPDQELKVSKSEESKKIKQESTLREGSQSTGQIASAQSAQPSSSSSSMISTQYPPPNYAAPPYPPQQGAQGPGYHPQGGNQAGFTPQQTPYATPPPYTQGQYNQSDPNYANYQNWSYSQTGYGSGYNQGWGNYYNY